MSEVCTDGRFEIIAAYKKKLIESTNIETSPDEMKVIDNVLFRFWQMGWLPPVPHGRLIDADALCKIMKKHAEKHNGFGGLMVMMAETCVANAPTIIPASGGKEEGE